MDCYSVNEHLTILDGLNEDGSIFVVQSTMSLHDTQGVKFDIIFFSLICAYFYLS